MAKNCCTCISPTPRSSFNIARDHSLHQQTTTTSAHRYKQRLVSPCTHPSPPLVRIQRLEILPSIVAGMMSDKPALQLECTIQLRKLLSIEINPPIDQVIAHHGLVSRLVQFLSFDCEPKLQLEASWALTNIASGSSAHTRIVIKNGAVPALIQLLAFQKDADVKEQVMNCPPFIPPVFEISKYQPQSQNHFYVLE